MNEHLTEEQQVEQLKEWWKQNGKSVVAGVVIGLGAVLGWQGWSQYQQSQAEAASAQYDQLLGAVRGGSAESAQALAERLSSDYAGSPYAFFAALESARAGVEKGDLAEARKQLEWAVANAPDQALAPVARLRLARVLIAQQDWDEVQKVLDGAGDGAYAAEFAVIRGDLAVARGDQAAARAAYAEALQGQIANPDLVQMKLDDLAPATPAS